MSRNKFNVNNRSDRVSLGNSFGARVQDTSTPKTLTTYLGLPYYRQDLGRNRVVSPKYFVPTLNLGKKTRFLEKS
jgi:hypothetical protein